MGWFSRLFGGETANRSTAQTPAPAPRVAAAARPYFAIVDVETTGLSPRADRVVELAVVRIDQHGNVVDEWSSRFNPEGSVGATHIHGITQADVDTAPLFRDLAPHIVPYIAGLPLAAHNARFDLAFLRAEFRRAGWDIPWLPAYCTLDGSHHYLPALERRRLVDCCWGARIPLDNAHSALGDARATAGLLRHYLLDNRHPHPPLLKAPGEALNVTWPTEPARAPVASLPDERPGYPRITSTRPPQPALITQLTKLSLAEVLDEGAPVGSLSYIETVLDALEDGVITNAEAAAMRDLVEIYNLTDDVVADTHNALLLALAHRALDDGHVSRDERAQLEAVADLLGLSGKLVPALIAEADAARAARLGAHLGSLPTDWVHGEPLRVGAKVVFTGFVGRERERTALEDRSRELGVRVLGNVSGLTAMLVTDGSYAGGKLERAHELGTRVVSPETYATLLKHLQPAATASKAKQTAPSSSVSSGLRPESPSTTTSPGEIRAWGLANGWEVGVRGRLSSELVEAYQSAVQITVTSDNGQPSP